MKKYYELSTNYLSSENTFPLAPGNEPTPRKVKINGEPIWLWIHVDERSQQIIIANVAEVEVKL